MMKGRYKDDAEEGEMEQQQQQQKKNAPRKQDDGRFQDCNEHLYQAFQELHGLAQGAFATCWTAAVDNACRWLVPAAAFSWRPRSLCSAAYTCALVACQAVYVFAGALHFLSLHST